jgi:hypothetical protein
MLMKISNSISFPIKNKSRWFLLLLIVLISNFALSQNSDNSLFFNKGKVYDIRENNLDYSQIKYFMKNYPDAMSYLKKAKTIQVIGSSIIGSGLACFAVSVILGEAITSTDNYRDSDYNLFWTFLGAGSVLAITGLVVNTGYRINLRTSVSLYNSSISSIKTAQSISMKIGLMPGGIRFAVQF